MLHKTLHMHLFISNEYYTTTLAINYGFRDNQTYTSYLACFVHLSTENSVAFIAFNTLLISGNIIFSYKSDPCISIN